MLEAVSKSFFSWDFTVYDGVWPVAEIAISRWGERGEFALDGRIYRVYREGLMRGAFILETEGVILARAQKPSAFRRLFRVEHAGREYILRARSAFSRDFLFLEGPAELGSLAPKGFFTRRMVVNLPEDLPLPLRIFFIWLTLILWRREAESAT